MRGNRRVGQDIEGKNLYIAVKLEIILPINKMR